MHVLWVYACMLRGGWDEVVWVGLVFLRSSESRAVRIDFQKVCPVVYCGSGATWGAFARPGSLGRVASTRRSIGEWGRQDLSDWERERGDHFRNRPELSKLSKLPLRTFFKLGTGPAGRRGSDWRLARWQLAANSERIYLEWDHFLASLPPASERRHSRPGTNEKPARRADTPPVAQLAGVVARLTADGHVRRMSLPDPGPVRVV